MPIIKLSASEAIDSVKSNPNSRWPKRGTINRLSPMAKPGLSTGFTLPVGGTIFTIGSCFARNVERVLQDRGFKLPAFDVLDQDEDFASVGNRVLNNYGAPSICNELKWAFEDETDEDACFYQMGNGWVDLHLHNTMRPADLEVVRNRRRALRAAYRSIVDCDAVIITLGLSEGWFDMKTGFYLNMAPRRSMVREAPDRFELHVLSYSETINCLREAIELIKEKGRDGIQVIVTVSPVPLTATYRDADVMTANCYSKSVLRTAAEEITQTFDFVHYFPSFESITLSDRSVAYTDDEIHVSQDIVDLNIGRMVQAYTGVEVELTLEDVRIELDTYRARPKIGYEVLTDNIDFCADPEVAGVLAECATSVGRYDVAELTLTNDDSGMLQAQLHMVQDNAHGALAAIKSRPEDAPQLARFFGLRIRANVMIDQYDNAVEAAVEWADMAPNSPTPFKVLAKLLAAQNDPRAEKWFARAVDVSGGNTGLILDMVDYLLKTGNRAGAKDRLSDITQASDQEERRKTRLLRAV